MNRFKKNYDSKDTDNITKNQERYQSRKFEQRRKLCIQGIKKALTDFATCTASARGTITKIPIHKSERHTAILTGPWQAVRCVKSVRLNTAYILEH